LDWTCLTISGATGAEATGVGATDAVRGAEPLPVRFEQAGTPTSSAAATPELNHVALFMVLSS